MREDTLTIVKNFELFKNVETELISLLIEDAEVRAIEAGELICFQDEPSKNLFLILEGQVEIQKNEMVISKLSKGDHFGEMSALGDGLRTTSVIAIEKSYILEIDAEKVTKYLYNSIDGLKNISKCLYQRLKLSNDLMLEQYRELELKYKELHQATGQIIESDRMASLGRVASSIAHEIKNPLTVINGYGEVLKRSAESNDLSTEKVLQSSEKIIEMGHRIVKVINSIQNLARGEQGKEFERFLIKDFIVETVSLCSELMTRKNVQVLLDPIPELEVQGNRVQLSQVILNLLHNGCQASQASDRDEKWVKIHFQYNEKQVQVLIEDSGLGVSKDQVSQLFTQKFTTKPRDEGTGLGLVICQKIINLHQGSIYLDQDAKNTTFVVELPLSISLSKAN
jgi:signal transduction histidine kinase